MSVGQISCSRAIFQSKYSGHHSPTFPKLRAISWRPIDAKGYQSFIHTSEINIGSIYLCYHLNDLHLSEDANNVNAIFGTDTRATHVVLAGDLVPAGTTLVTHGLLVTLI